MDQLIFASLSHSHYWYEVGMLKVPAVCTFSIREDGDRKILRQDTKACVWPTHKNQEKTPEIHTAFRICRLLAFTPNTMYVVVLYLQPMYVCISMHGPHIYSRVWINRVRLPILPVVS